jgi:transcriptional regulator with XRE-family HTH domain
MPRRATPDPTALAVGARIRVLRGEQGLTAERVAFESEVGSKGFLSDIEQGRARPSIATLRHIADYLGVRLVDLFTFPEASEREALIDRTRWLTPGAVRKLLRDMPRPPQAPGGATARATTKAPGPAKSRGYEGRPGKEFDVAEPRPAGTEGKARKPATGEARRRKG